jgi:hypothetical protein
MVGCDARGTVAGFISGGKEQLDDCRVSQRVDDVEKVVRMFETMHQEIDAFRWAMRGRGPRQTITEEFFNSIDPFRDETYPAAITGSLGAD